jgi:predicted aspartyl protease
MQQFDKLLICAVSLLIYSVCAGFPSLKASEPTQAKYGTTLSRSTGNHLFVSVRVNNRPAWFAIDTGAALSIVDSNKAKLLGLSIGPGVINRSP